MSGAVHKIDYLNDKKSPLLWGSHLPVLQAAIDAFPLTGALELGAGLHSTPLLFENLSFVASIENKADWIRKLREEGVALEDGRHYLAHYPFEHNIKLHREEIGQVALKKATEFYRSHMKQKPNLLFIDCYRGYRLQALIDLHADFDVIVYHDAQPKVDFRYGYSTFVPNSNYLQFVDRTFPTHTGILINSKLEPQLPVFRNRLGTYATQLAAKYSVVPTVFLDRLR